MTTRDFLNSVISSEISEEITAKACEMLVALDKKNESRRTKGTKSQRENSEIKEKILSEILPNVTYTAKQVADMFELSSTQKASALLKQMENAGDLISETVKTKSGKVIGYKLVIAED